LAAPNDAGLTQRGDKTHSPIELAAQGIEQAGRFDRKLDGNAPGVRGAARPDGNDLPTESDPPAGPFALRHAAGASNRTASKSTAERRTDPRRIPAGDSSADFRLRDSTDCDAWASFERVWLERESAVETADKLSLQIESVYHAKSRVLKRLADELEQIIEDFSWLDDLQTARG
jgi:hypothetical protein